MNAYEKAVGLLKIRPHYSGELAKKLTLRGFKRQEVDEVINRLHDSGMLNDAQFAETFLANLIRFKTFGFYGLKVKLMQRGMASQDAEVLLKENLSLEQEQEIAERLLEKLQGKSPPPPPPPRAGGRHSPPEGGEQKKRKKK